MLRYFIVVKIMTLLAMSICQADDIYDQSVIAQVNKYFTSNSCLQECTFRVQSSDIEIDPELTGVVNLTRLGIDLNADGEPDYILSSEDYCGAGNCIEALLASNNKKLIKVFGGQGIAYFSQSTNGFRDLVQGKRGPGQKSYGGTGRIPVYRWNGERYIESGSIDDQTSKVTSIHADLSAASQKQDIMENSDQCIGKTFNVQKGETICGFLLDNKGNLYYKNRKVSEPVVATYSSDGSQSLADSLIIYASSPSGRYYYIKACGEGMTPLCWSQWLFDSGLNKFQSISIGRYGAHPEIYWNSDDRFAALFYSDEGHDQINILDAETGKIWVFPDWGNHDSNVLDIDKKSFAWIDSHSFNIDAAICKETKFATSDCGANISSVLKTKTIFNIEGEKLNPTTSLLGQNKVGSEPKTANSTPLLAIENSAEKMCQGLPVACQDIYKKVAKAWWNEAINQMQDSHTATRSFEMLFSNPGAILNDAERLQLFENMLDNKAFVGELRDQLKDEFLSREDIGFPKLDKAAMINIASDIAESLLTDIVIEYTALGLEKNGKSGLAYWIRTTAKPSIDIIQLAKGLAAGSTTFVGASLGAGGVWATNIFSFTVLGIHLNADERSGKDVDSELARLANQNVSIFESLMSGETRGALYEGYSVRRLTQKEIDALQDMLITNNNYQSELLKKQAIYAEFDWVVKYAKWFACVVSEVNNSYSGSEHANSTPSFIDMDKQKCTLPNNNSYSGLEHANSTPSFIGVEKQTGTQPKNIDPVGKTVTHTPKEPAKKNCQQQFNYSSAVTGVGAQSALSKYAFDQGECQ